VFEAVFAIILAVVIAAAVAWPIKWRHRKVRGAGAAWLFAVVVLFPILWLAGVYLPPVGPPVAGAHWVMMVIVGLLLLMLIALVAPPLAGKAADIPEVDAHSVGTAMVFLDWMLWGFLIMVTGLLVIGLVQS